MTRRMRTSTTGLELIKGFEGFRARSTQLPNGIWTIGYGHTKAAKAGLRITPADGEAVLREYDLPRFEKAISNLVMAPLNQNEFDALVSFVFNIGGRAFAESRVLTLLNAGEPLAAADAMSAWRKAFLNGNLTVVDALVRRRAAEVALFLNSPSGNPSASSARVRPILDVSLKPHFQSTTATKPKTTSTGAMFPPGATTPASPPAASGAVPADPDLPAAALTRPDDARLTRVLGEPEPTSAPAGKPEPAYNPGPTPDDITRAISALANAESTTSAEPVANINMQPATNSVAGHAPQADWPEPASGDLPPLPRSVMNGQRPRKVAIDDLEEAPVDPVILAEAMKNADGRQVSANPPARPAVIARIGLGVTGLILAAFGLTRIAGGIENSVTGNAAQFLSIGSLVFGVCFMALAIYLAVRNSTHLAQGSG